MDIWHCRLKYLLRVKDELYWGRKAHWFSCDLLWARRTLRPHKCRQLTITYIITVCRPVVNHMEKAVLQTVPSLMILIRESNDIDTLPYKHGPGVSPHLCCTA